MAFTQVQFSKVYAGSATNKEYCNWYTSNVNTASAFGIYSAKGITACQQTSSEIKFGGVNFPVVKRFSNFLVPIIIATDTVSATDKMISFNDTRLSDDESHYIYNIANPSGKLQNYNINNELAASFLVDSLIVTAKTSTNISFFSIFYNLNKVAIYNSTDNTGIQITAEVQYNDSFHKNNVTLTQLQDTTKYKFYKYVNLPFNNTNTSAVGTLTAYTVTSIDQLYNDIATGTMYITKGSLAGTNFTDPLRHPTYINGKIVLNYYNSSRSEIIQQQTINMAGTTTDCVKFNNFQNINSNGYILRYAEKNTTAFNNITGVASEVFLSGDIFDYAGGTLVGWTTDRSYGFSTAVQWKTTAPYTINTAITGSLYDSTFYSNNADKSYFYFSNKKGSADNSGLTGPSNITILTLDLYPVYKQDPNWLPRVVEITPRLRNDVMSNAGKSYVTWTKDGAAALFNEIKTYYNDVVAPTTSTGTQWTNGSGAKYITLKSGNGTTKSVAMGSSIEFTGATTPVPNPRTSNSFIVTIDGVQKEVPVNMPTLADILGTNGSSGTTAQFLRGDGQWSNELEGPCEIGRTRNNTFTANVVLNNQNVLGESPDGTIQGTPVNGQITYSKSTGASIYTLGGICAEKNIWGAKVFNAVFNDYAEYRTTINLTPGHVVIDQDDGSLACSTTRLQPGAQVISDTFGHAMGQTPKATTPIAVAGRVLVYTYQPRENYHAGMAVCSAPDGTVDIMTREEIRDYPDCIVGIVSEIPEYETWGSDNINVDGRIWVRIK